MSTTGAMHLWVYPRSCPLAPLRSGFAKDAEGPTTALVEPQGGVPEPGRDAGQVASGTVEHGGQA